MKKIIALSLVSITILQLSCTSSQTFNVFQVKLKAKDVVGTSSFNDLGLSSYTEVIPDLTDDTLTFLWRLGTIRRNAFNYKKGTLPLFNLATANHKGGYALLDSIDFTYYKERGFQILESRKPNILRDEKYLEFKYHLYDENMSIKSKRDYIWLDNNSYYRDELQNTKYHKNSQPITVSHKLTEKITSSIKLTLERQITDLVNRNQLNDSSSNVINTKSINLYFEKLINKSLILKGSYISASYQNEYIHTISSILNSLNELSTIYLRKKYGFDDEFYSNLVWSMNSRCAVINSAVFAFRLNGSLDKKVTSTENIKSDLISLFGVSNKQATSLAIGVNSLFDKHIEETFTNQFSKVWIFMFGTHSAISNLTFKDGYSKKMVGPKNCN